MKIKITRAQRVGIKLEFEICPNWDEECKCERELVRVATYRQETDDNTEHLEPNGQLTFAHEVYTFSTDSPEGFKGNWANHCANEALALAKSQIPSEPEDLDKLVGKEVARTT